MCVHCAQQKSNQNIYVLLLFVFIDTRINKRLVDFGWGQGGGIQNEHTEI